jgi:hypothetical protein
MRRANSFGITLHLLQCTLDIGEALVNPSLKHIILGLGELATGREEFLNWLIKNARQDESV